MWYAAESAPRAACARANASTETLAISGSSKGEGVWASRLASLRAKVRQSTARLGRAAARRVSHSNAP